MKHTQRHIKYMTHFHTHNETHLSWQKYGQNLNIWQSDFLKNTTIYASHR
jgi:hypothetical protein